jgi:hypothetical protein
MKVVKGKPDGMGWRAGTVAVAGTGMGVEVGGTVVDAGVVAVGVAAGGNVVAVGTADAAAGVGPDAAGSAHADANTRRLAVVRILM